MIPGAGWLRAKFRQPRRAGAAATHGGVGLAMQPDSFGQQPFESVPKMQRVEQGIQQIGDSAVVAVLRISVVPRVMLAGLQNFDVLQQEWPVKVLIIVC